MVKESLFLSVLCLCFFSLFFTIGNVEAYNFFEDGYTLGKNFKEGYSTIVKEAKQYSFYEKAKELSIGHKEDLARYYPEYLERLDGIARAAGVSTKDLIAATFVLNLGPKCAQAGVAPPATKDGQVYLSWNFESALMARPLFTIPFFVVVRPTSGYKYLFWGVPYILGVSIMNETGLSLAASAMNYDDDGPGLTSFEIASMAMERCKNIPEVVEMLDSVPRFSSSDPMLGPTINWTFSMADAEGNVAMIEFTHNYLDWDYGEDGVVGRANTYQLLPLEKSTCQPNSPHFSKAEALACWGADVRALRMWELARANYGNIDLAKMKEFTEDLNGGEDFLGRPAGSWWTPERHGHTLPTDLARFQDTPYIPIIFDFGYVITHAVFIYEPLRKVVWWTPGHPSRFGHIPIFAGYLMGVSDFGPDSYYGEAKNIGRIVHSIIDISDEIGSLIGLGAGMFAHINQEREVAPGFPILYSTQLS